MSSNFDDFLKLTAAQETDRELARKYKNFGNHIDLYESAISAYLMVSRAFSAKEVTQSPNTAAYSDDLRTWMQALGGTANSFEHFIDVQKNYIETRLSLPAVTLNFNYREPGRLAAAERIIRNFLPAFQIPRTFEKIPNSGGFSPFFKIGEDLIEFSSVEKLSRAKPDYTPGFQAEDASTGFTLPKGYSDKGFNGISFLDIRLNMEGVQLRDMDSYYAGTGIPDRGSLLDKYTAYPVLNVDAVFRWPIEFARWVTCTDEGEEFVPFMFFQYMNSHRSAYLAKRTRGGGYSVHTPARVNHLGKIVQLMGEERKQGRIAKIRTNEDGFLILGTGEPSKLGTILWVPLINNVNEYMNQIKSCYDPSEKKLDTSKFKLSGAPILTDPNNEKFTYVRESGLRGSSDISGLITFSLTGSVALDKTTIFRYLSTRLSYAPNEKNLKDLLVGLYAYATRRFGGTEISNLLSSQTLSQMGFDSFDARKGADLLQEAADFFLTSTDLDLKWMHFAAANKFNATVYLSDKPIEEDSEEATNSTTGIQNKMRRARAFLTLVYRVSQSMLRDFDSLTLGFATKVEFWRFYLYLICNYSGDAKELSFDYQDKVELNSARPYQADEVLNPKGLTIPNMPGLKRALPHQVECFLDFNMEPEMTMLEADVGGGKGMMGPVQALMYMQKGLVKRPLFLVPGRLVSNWVDEIGKYTEGQVNPFPLTLPIVRRLQRVYQGEKGQNGRPDYRFLKKIIDACPINTFFISSFNFLVSDSDVITYANTEAARYYAAEFFRDLGIFDLVVMDESHNVKNLTTRATVASSVIASPAKFKTEMSGTFVANVLTDLVGQVAIGNPAALGSTTRFVKRYALQYTGRSGQLQVSEWRPDAASMIVNDMKPYAKRIIKKKDRWAFFLPRTNELFHTAELTANQQSFYDLQLNKKIEELKEKNPSLYQKMMDGNEKDQASIAVGLDKSFQSLEAFLGAPDLDAEYSQIKGLSEDDLTSAKLKETVTLLDKHFQGYTDDEGAQVAASEYKVIIFASRIPTVQHFERRMPERYKKMMATYYAGGEQALEAFKTLPGIKILLAAEMSANTGQNFQVGSRMIRLEALWGPGGQIQAAGRIERPDFSNTGRTELHMDWIVVNKTLDVAKTARLISKSVEKMKYDRQEDPFFKVNTFKPSAFLRNHFGAALPKMREDVSIEKMFTTLPLIKMNFATFRKVNDIRQLDPYFASYALMLDFQQQQYEREKAEGLHTLVDITDDMRTTLPGSRKIDFMPRVPNINPANFDLKNEWGYKPISRMQLEIDLKKLEIEDDDKDDDFNEDTTAYEDINPVNENDIVDTEFGIGFVKKILKNEVWVDIPGFRKVRVLKACTWLITNEKKLQEIKIALNRGKTFVRRAPGLGDEAAIIDEPIIDIDEVEENTAPVAPEIAAPTVPERPTETVVVPEFPDEEEPTDEFDQEEEEQSSGNDNKVNMYAYVIDGQPALTCFAEDMESDNLIEDFDFLHFASFYAIEVKTPVALDKILAVLTKKFSVDPKALADLESYRPLLSNKSMIDSISPNNLRAVTRFFKTTQRKRLQKGQLRPYPIAWGKSFFIAIDQISTPSYNQALMAVKNAAIPGVEIKKNRQDDVHVRFLPNPNAGVELLRQIRTKMEITNLEHCLKLLRSMQKRPEVKSTRDRTAPSPKTNAAPSRRPAVRSTRNR